MIKDKTYNFVLAEKVRLGTSRRFFKPREDYEFDILCTSMGFMRRFTRITNETLEKMPITALCVLKCPKDTVLIKVNEEE